MTIWAYYRVSSDEQTCESQKVGVVDYAKKHGITINKEVVDDGISGTILAKYRNLNIILKKAQKDDLLIVSELSRLGRSTSDVLNTCQTFIKNGVNVYFVKQNMSLDSSPMGKMMIAILAAFAEMERDLISQRTIEGQIRARNAGVHIGRPKGITSRKLAASYIYIKQCLDAGLNKSQIARRCRCSWSTLHRFMKERHLCLCDICRPETVEDYALSEEIRQLKEEDEKREKGYLTIEDFRKVYE